MSTDIEITNIETSLSPALFNNSDDRRTAPRVPFEESVRVGPAYGAPYAVLSAENLSAGGIFIKTDKKAEPGAKFSVELSLPNYGRLYIPEVEVLYNRLDDTAGCFGFGASFTGLTDEVEDVLTSIASFPSEILSPNGGAVSASMICESQTLHPTASPQPIRHSRIVRDEMMGLGQERAIKAEQFPALQISDLTLSLPPEPGLDSNHEKAKSRRDENTDIVRVRAKKPYYGRRTTRAIIVEKARDLGESIGFELPHLNIGRTDAKRALFGGLVVGSIFAFAVAFAVKRNNALQSPVASPVELAQASIVSADTHENLNARQASVIGLQPQAPVQPVLKKEVPTKPLVRTSIPLPPVSATKELKKAQALKKQALAPTPKTAPAKVVPKEIVKLSQNSQELQLSVSPDATVLRSYVLKNPARLVIDVAGQDGALSLPAVTGPISAIRTGEHTGYTRIVIDSERPIKDSKVEKKGDGLRVSLDS